MPTTKGIILAGGKATRLYPLTLTVSKQLLPLYDKPMIYYPLTTLMTAGIRDVLIISQEENLPHYRAHFGDGKRLGLRIQYAAQSQPRGLADAFLVAEDAGYAWGQHRLCLILGDNFFHGAGFRDAIRTALDPSCQAEIFAYQVQQPEKYGVLSFVGDRVTDIHEKPKVAPSNWAVTGIYVYPPDVLDKVKQLKPSQRGELEITDLNRSYLKGERLHVNYIGEGNAWLDTGTPADLLAAAEYVHTIQERQGVLVGSPEQEAMEGAATSDERQRLKAMIDLEVFLQTGCKGPRDSR